MTAKDDPTYDSMIEEQRMDYDLQATVLTPKKRAFGRSYVPHGEKTGTVMGLPAIIYLGELMETTSTTETAARLRRASSA